MAKPFQKFYHFFHFSNSFLILCPILPKNLSTLPFGQTWANNVFHKAGKAIIERILSVTNYLFGNLFYSANLLCALKRWHVYTCVYRNIMTNKTSPYGRPPWARWCTPSPSSGCTPLLPPPAQKHNGTEVQKHILMRGVKAILRCIHL